MPRDTDSIFAHGAVIVPDFVTPAEEARILLRIAEAPWMTEHRPPRAALRLPLRATGGGSRSRRRPSRGGRSAMAERLRPHFGGALPVQCIVNEYRPGQGIGMHADHRDFGPVVASLSLADDWPMRFRPRATRPYAAGAMPGDEVATLPRRSVLVLSGVRAGSGCMASTAAPATRDRTRLSATFRTLAVARPPGSHPSLSGASLRDRALVLRIEPSGARLDPAGFDRLRGGLRPPRRVPPEALARSARGGVRLSSPAIPPPRTRARLVNGCAVRSRGPLG